MNAKPLTEEEIKELYPILKNIREDNGENWKRLSEKCNREQKVVYFVLREYGHLVV